MTDPLELLRSELAPMREELTLLRRSVVALQQDTRAFLDTVRTERPDGTVSYLDPGNYLGRIEHFWAMLSVDEGGEGVCAVPMPGVGTVPLIAADRDRLEDIIPMAKQIATAFGKPVRLAKFTTREDVEIYQP